MMGKLRAKQHCSHFSDALADSLLSRSLLNLLQQYNYWESYFDDVGTDPDKANLLGLLTNMFTIGSILSMFTV
jgi:hypothetical protein